MVVEVAKNAGRVPSSWHVLILSHLDVVWHHLPRKCDLTETKSDYLPHQSSETKLHRVDFSPWVAASQSKALDRRVRDPRQLHWISWVPPIRMPVYGVDSLSDALLAARIEPRNPRMLHWIYWITPVYGVGSPSSALLAVKIKFPGFQETPGAASDLRFFWCFWCLLVKVGDYKT